MNKMIKDSVPISFLGWINEFTETLKGNNDGEVPCGDCIGCCTSSLFIHIKPSDKDSLNHIPKELMFPAPDLPKGHYLLGYDEKGHCPMFKKDQCSIYPFRPETCRQYDCRIYPATGIYPDNARSKILAKAKTWNFDLNSSKEKHLFDAVQKASKFLITYKKLFPDNFYPKNESQQAVLSIQIHSIFIELESEYIINNAKKLVDEIILNYS